MKQKLKLKEKLEQAVNEYLEVGGDTDFVIINRKWFDSEISKAKKETLISMQDWVVEYYKDTWNIRDFDAEIAIGKIIDRELDKLTTR